MTNLQKLDMPSVMWKMECGSLTMVHYINTDVSSVSYVDGRGLLNYWYGFTWETLNTINGKNVYRTGFIGVMDKSLVFHCLTTEDISDSEAADKRLRFYYISQVAPFMNYRELRAVVEAKCKE